MLKIGALIVFAVLSAATISIQAAPTTPQPPTASAGKGNYQNQPKPSDKTSATHNHDVTPNQGTSNPNLILPPKVEVEIRNVAQHGEDKPSRDYIEYILVALGVIVAGFTFRAIYRQANIMEGTLAQMRIDAASRAVETEKQLKVATDTAAAAQKSADVAERTLTDLETPFVYPVVKSHTFGGDTFRAFVLYDSPDDLQHPATPIVSFRIKNYGRTPALLRSVAANMCHWTAMVAAPRADIYADYAVEPVLEPDKETGRTFETVVPIVNSEFKSVRAGTSHIFLFGEVIFADIFGNDYIQTFCMAYDYGSQSFIPWASRYNKRKRQQQEKA